MSPKFYPNSCPGSLRFGIILEIGCAVPICSKFELVKHIHGLFKGASACPTYRCLQRSWACPHVHNRLVAHHMPSEPSIESMFPPFPTSACTLSWLQPHSPSKMQSLPTVAAPSCLKWELSFPGSPAPTLLREPFLARILPQPVRKVHSLGLSAVDFPRGSTGIRNITAAVSHMKASVGWPHPQCTVPSLNSWALAEIIRQFGSEVVL